MSAPKERKITQIKEWRDVDKKTFEREIISRNQPAVIRNLVADWPVVQKARQSSQQALQFMASLDSKASLYTIIGEPEIGGRFFYNEDLSGVNFKRGQATLSQAIEQLHALKDSAHPHAIAIQSAAVDEAMPGFRQQHHQPLLDKSIAPTLWVGNRAMVAAHYDVHDNIACVVVGQRKFTLFPPDQIANLYVGPTLVSPGGVPISMVDLGNPDFQRFPKFEQALDSAQQALLEPGDAIFIPTPWWHAVESLDAVNVLINYWWGGLNDSSLSPNNSLMHSMLTVAKLSAAQRQSWRHFFDYFVFQTSADPAAHLPDELHDVVTSLTPEQRQLVYKFLRDRLQ